MCGWCGCVSEGEDICCWCEWRGRYVWFMCGLCVVGVYLEVMLHVIGAGI